MKRRSYGVSETEERSAKEYQEGSYGGQEKTYHRTSAKVSTNGSRQTSVFGSQEKTTSGSVEEARPT
jgi:hypothetical protein